MRRGTSLALRHAFVAVAATAVASLVVSACGKDVFLGGTAEADAAIDVVQEAAPPNDAAPPTSQACEPCATSSDCVGSASCAVLDGGDTYCLPLCPKGNECGDAGDCRAVTASAGDPATACVPSTGSCAPAQGPSVDGAPLDRCGDLVAPFVSATCHSCNPSSSTCQPNGCYGGWWCNTYYHRCQKPPTTC